MTPSQEFIPLSVPELRGNEWKYIKECLDTNWVSAVGKFVDRFERTTADALGAAHAVATVNGTAALHIALQVAGVKPGEEVLVSTLTFIAPANAIRYAGAWPTFIDAEPEYWQMDPDKVVDFLERRCQWRDGGLYNSITGRRVTAIVPVHVLGHPVNMDPILEVSRKYGLKVIEDATESLGSKYKNQPAGHLADISCLSFNGNKIITTGGGGMMVTDNGEWARKAKYLTTQAKDDELEYIHGEVGYNYRLVNLLAALGCAQMEQLDTYVEIKRLTAAKYNKAFEDMPGMQPMREAPWAFSNCWMYTVLIDKDAFGKGSRDLLQDLSERNIQTRPLWQPIHLSAAHTGSFAVDCSVAERLNRDALSLPCSVGLTQEQQERVIERITAIAATYAR